MQRIQYMHGDGVLQYPQDPACDGLLRHHGCSFNRLPSVRLFAVVHSDGRTYKHHGAEPQSPAIAGPAKKASQASGAGSKDRQLHAASPPAEDMAQAGAPDGEGMPRRNVASRFSRNQQP